MAWLTRHNRYVTQAYLNLLTSFTFGKSIDDLSAYRIQFGKGACYPDSLGRSPNLARGNQETRRWFDTSVFDSTNGMASSCAGKYSARRPFRCWTFPAVPWAR